MLYTKVKQEGEMEGAEGVAGRRGGKNYTTQFTLHGSDIFLLMYNKFVTKQVLKKAANLQGDLQRLYGAPGQNQEEVCRKLSGAYLRPGWQAALFMPMSEFNW